MVTTLVKFLQLSKAYISIVIIPYDIVKSPAKAQLLKAAPQIVLTLFGIVKLPINHGHL